jgi:GNAT superfamily N-acetyltransferase
MNKKDFVVTPYEPAAHKSALLQFLGAVYPPGVLKRRELVLDWIHEHHPHRDMVPLRYVIMDGDRVAATMGHLPADFLVNGQPTPVRFTHDLLVDPSYRGQGLAKLIVGNSLAGGDFLPGGMWMTVPCYKIHLACGFDDASPLVTRTLVLDPDAVVRRKQLPAIKRWLSKPVLRLLRARSLARAGKLADHRNTHCDTLVAGEFDPEWDGTWRGMLEGYGIGMIRNAEYLNWKYAHHPVLNYRIRLAERGGRMTGYIISRLAPEQADEKRSVITDFLVENGDAKTLETLVAHVIIEASEAGMEVVSVLTTQTWAATTLRGFGFVPRKESHTWVVGGWKGHIPEGWIADHEQWHMCSGDSDGDLWTGSA